MATLKKQPRSQWLKDSIARLEARKEDSPIVAERWYVIEQWPSSEDEFGGYESGGHRVVSNTFDNEADALAWMEHWEPEPGTTFKIVHQNKRRITREEWVSW